MTSKLICGDCVEVMKSLEPESIDLTITSPPYDNLRLYTGYSFDFESTARELYRVTKVGGVVVWVVGDQTVKGSESGTSFKQALFFKEIGFNLHDTMIYRTNKPPLTHNRYEQEFEYMFVFSRRKPKTFNPIMVKTKWGGMNVARRTFRQDASGRLELSHKNQPVNDTKISGNIWHIPTGRNGSTKDYYAFDHPAIFPEQLAGDHILSWSNPGDLILDCFVGSGTTGKMALKYGRNFIGIDSSQQYIDIATKRLEDEVLNSYSKLFHV